MTKPLARLVVLAGFVLVGVAGVNVGLQAHHAVAGVYDLNKEVVLQGVLKKLNFTNWRRICSAMVPPSGRALSLYYRPPACLLVVRSHQLRRFFIPARGRRPPAPHLAAQSRVLLE